ncbi:sensor histidine kinase [Legionella spiritensis]|uniref:histidine kinase n=1 Tax=Legionella spiritensis TaxID=452 RepID=A0A0W0YXP8_LEGSP|nr:HAMP domain-containing sensor histidine kinase [Legionella spiritensis]KTD61608.1 sensor histidine kinase/response regulator LuxN [Legionella spiritensis]SNV39418.1 sensor histidine kinase/response regulator LuxN [Legionella spiritensis]VEG90378.1 sensor histidine kinase/response regulator LuxN [Legionella spiritensis]
MQRLNNIFHNVYQYIVKQTEDASHQITLFGLVMMVNFPLFGVFWKLESFQLSEEFFLRLLATTLCALLAANKFWPLRVQKILPVFWYMTLLYCLPFFFAYLTLLNHGATLWLMNCVSAIFFLLLVTSVLGALVLLCLGVGFAFIYFFYMTGNAFEYIPGSLSTFSLMITYSAAVIIGALFARDREIIQAGRLSGMRLLAGSLAHDLRTPLASIHMQAELQEMILDKLNNSEVQKILKESLHKITRGIEMGNQLISMQLHNISRDKFDTSTFTIHSIKYLLEKTLDDYPLEEEQKSLVKLNLDVDFSVWVEEVAFKNLMWNLLKNSFEFIEETGKGNIMIWLEPGDEKDDFNYLHVRDTAKGLLTKNNDRIFESFFSDRKEGTGVGLAYCKLLMEAAGGGITCKGKDREFAHFIVKFPKVD